MQALREYLSTHLEEDILDMGYIEPEHRVKGKQVWLVDDEDIAEMYTRFKTKQEITLWCHAQKGSEETSVASDKQRSATCT